MIVPGNCELFDGISSTDITKLFSCFNLQERTFLKGQTIIQEGNLIDSIGLILNGFVQILRNDYEGNRTIEASFGTGAVFAESFICAGINQSPVTVIAVENSTIVFIPFIKITRQCKSSCLFHHQLIENMIKLLARKNILLSAKIKIVAKRTIRDKVLAFLEQERRKNNSTTFEIPYSRNELADFLYVDRSALSRELSNMKNEALINFERNSFTLL